MTILLPEGYAENRYDIRWSILYRDYMEDRHVHKQLKAIYSNTKMDWWDKEMRAMKFLKNWKIARAIESSSTPLQEL